MRKFRDTLCALLLVGALLAATPCLAQRVRFDSSAPQNGGTTTFQGSGAFQGNGSFQGGTQTAPPTGFAPNGGLAPVNPPSGATFNGSAGAAGQPPSFDPFSSQPDAASQPPALLGSPTTSPNGSAPPQTYSQPPYTQPGATPYYGQPYPGYPGQPPSVFPGGLPWQPPQLAPVTPGQYLRLFEKLRFSHTWLEGGPGRELDINDIEGSVTMNLPNFLWSGQPISISPVYIVHLWAGPTTGAATVSPFADLPEDAHSIYGNASWNPKITEQLGGEISANVGVFTDLRTFNTNTVRVFGRGLLTLQLTPTLMIKGGVEYLDRLDKNLLPAGGLLWTPNQDVRFDIYFPKPKLAQRLTTLGNTDIWWYLGGEYGGGSWTIERPMRTAAGMPIPGMTFSDQVDINDIRAIVGLEWLSGLLAVKGFVEAGYVFDRELIYRVGPPFNQTLKDTFMIRGGLSY